MNKQEIKKEERLVFPISTEVINFGLDDEFYKEIKETVKRIDDRIKVTREENLIILDKEEGEIDWESLREILAEQGTILNKIVKEMEEE